MSFLVILGLCAGAAGITACSGGKTQPRSSYEIYASYDGAGALTGTAELTFVNDTGNEISDLKFNLYGNAYRQDAKFKPVSKTYESRAYYAGASYGGMEIQNVENCAGWTVGGEDENVLTVNLASPVYPDGSVSVKIGYTLSLAKINHRTGVTANTVNLGNFYPILCAYSREGFIECPYYSCGDPFVSDCADYRVTFDVPESYTIAASGQLTGESVAEGRKKSEYELLNARDFAAVLSERFQTVEKEACGKKITYYYTADSGAETSAAAAAESLEYFSETFGEYAYPTLSVVQTSFCYGGMEYPGLTMIASGQTVQDSAYTIVHETAHQWWYAMVGSNQLTSPWQDEGLAEYSTAAFFENHPVYGYTRTGIVGAATRSYRAFFTVYSQLNGEADTTMTRNLGTYQSELEYNNITYNKGLLLFETLRKSLGDKKFFACLKSYFKDNCGRIASPESLIAAFAAEGDVEGLFSSFIDGKILI